MRPLFFPLRLLPLAALLLPLFFGGGPAARGQDPAVYHYVLIVDDLTARPDGKGNFSVNSGADASFSLRDGQLAFTDATGDSIWRAFPDSSNLLKVVDTSMAAPGGVGNFTSFNTSLGPPLNMTAVYFGATSAGAGGDSSHPNLGIYKIFPYQGQTPVRVVDYNVPVPGDPAGKSFTFLGGSDGMTNHFELGRSIVIYEGGNAGNAGVFYAQGDDYPPVALADRHHPTHPEMTPPVDDFGSPVGLFDGTVAFVGRTADDPGSGGFSALYARKYFDTPTFQYHEVITSDVVLPGDTYSTPHTRFDVPPLASDGASLVFLADDAFASPNPLSLYSVPVQGGSPPVKLVDATATPLPGLDTGVVRSFDGVACDVIDEPTPTNRLMFCAHDGNGHYGIYAMNADGTGAITKVIGTGDHVLDGLGRVNTVKSLFMTTNCLSNGYLVFKATYPGGNSGLFVAVFGGESAPPVITSPTTASAGMDQDFSYQITATHNPTRFTAVHLPAGLKVNNVKGTITGMPAKMGKFQITLKAYNSAGPGTATLTLTVGPHSPVITSSASASATQGKPFSYQITATNNPASYGVLGLPPGIHVDGKTGLISGTPTTSGRKALTLKATNAGGAGEATLILTILGPPVVTNADTAAAAKGKAFSYQITATNAPTGYGATGLPPGLTVDTKKGLITGTPTTAGTYQPVLKATNAAGAGQKTITLTVAAP